VIPPALTLRRDEFEETFVSLYVSRLRYHFGGMSSTCGFHCACGLWRNTLFGSFETVPYPAYALAPAGWVRLSLFNAPAAFEKAVSLTYRYRNWKLYSNKKKYSELPGEVFEECCKNDVKVFFSSTDSMDGFLFFYSNLKFRPSM